MNNQQTPTELPAITPLPTTGWSVPANLLRLAGPVIATMISRTVMSFVDFVMVSQLGTEAQAAIMPAGILLFTVTSLGMGMLTMVNTFVAQSLGRGRPADCSAYAWQGLYLSWAIGLLTLPFWFFVPAVFTWVGHEPAVRELEIVYVQIGVLGLAPMLGGMALANFFNGIHRPMVGFWAALISNLFNVAANYTLIFGHFGLPAMGIAGAAWATLLAGCLQMTVLLVWMLRPHCHRLYQSRQMWRPSLSRLRDIIWYGLPVGLHFCVDIGAWTIFTLFLVGQFGTEQLAANNIVFKLLELSFMPTVGLGVALTAAVGKAIGQKRRDLARLTVRWAMLFAVGYMGLVAVGYLTLRHPMIGLFTDDQAVTGWAAKLLIFCAIFQIFDALGITYGSALRGAGDSYWPAIAGTAYAVVIFLGGGYLLARVAPQWNCLGPWAAATVYISILGATLWLRFQFGPWERIEMLREPAPVLP